MHMSGRTARYSAVSDRECESDDRQRADGEIYDGGTWTKLEQAKHAHAQHGQNKQNENGRQNEKIAIDVRNVNQTQRVHAPAFE